MSKHTCMGKYHNCTYIHSVWKLWLHAVNPIMYVAPMHGTRVSTCLLGSSQWDSRWCGSPTPHTLPMYVTMDYPIYDAPDQPPCNLLKPAST